VAEAFKHAAAATEAPCRDTSVLGSFRDYVYMVHPQHNCVGGVPTARHLQIRLASDYCLVWLVKEPLYILRDTFVRQNPILSFVKFAGCAGNARCVPQHPVLGTTVTYSWAKSYVITSRDEHLKNMLYLCIAQRLQCLIGKTHHQQLSLSSRSALSCLLMNLKFSTWL
jgi:hypothetical protein